ncbi:ATP-binding cassette domain-containing protein [Zeaxanthinibacter enoshimensis]|uniref:Molybdate transport system ATP-binding protein n=1 Tax=Zeaxanthinibacter enoshimensis TaxID=392009 RepID=A0A4R6TIL7_9FLAO|nr:ATP-binding cassette domain-containing protein [Zeaxanthinibacter enoshimensis]TDQ29110.1 molybdate transport system ATP-binding protein [Zeaxanthinibacter enoshimensis]
MSRLPHWAVFTDNNSRKGEFISSLMDGEPPEDFKPFAGKEGALFSKSAVDHFLEEEARHDQHILSGPDQQELRTMSSGERKKALLNFLLNKQPDYLIIVNPFDNLDSDSARSLADLLTELSAELPLIQVLSRRSDMLPFASHQAFLEGDRLVKIENQEYGASTGVKPAAQSKRRIPPPPARSDLEKELLVRFNKVSVAYGKKPVLNNICWEIRKGEYWQLSGKNGSGKSTLLSMINGDNPKAYGEDIELFGYQKGSGETVWDLKEHTGYFSPAMVDRFRGYHSLENMIISGLTDSIGLYTQPSAAQQQLAREWLKFLELESHKDDYFHECSEGVQRLVMCARAMVKHPPLLILDEPTAGLDDQSAELLVRLVNTMAQQSSTAIIYVSHRKEEGLRPEKIFELTMTPAGSTGKVILP